MPCLETAQGTKITGPGIAASPKYPETFHYRGDGIFMISARSVNLSKTSKPENL